MVVFEPIYKFQKRFFKIFAIWVFLLVLIRFFLVFYRMLSMHRHFVPACSACIAHFLPHAQHA
jgi:hypothetical protein